MNDIIAGDPAPTNPTAREELLLLDGSDEWPAVVDRILARHRAAVLAETIKAAQCEIVTDGTGHPEDVAYDQGIYDAVDAIRRLTEEAAAQRSVDAQFPLVKAVLIDGGDPR